jgi:hypothetical protein
MNANFYSEHPCFLSAVNEHSEYFRNSINNLLPLSVSMECLDTDSTKDNLVKQVAILNCGDVCRTRWVERIEGLDTFTELFVPLYYTLEN